MAVTLHEYLQRHDKWHREQDLLSYLLLTLLAQKLDSPVCRHMPFQKQLQNVDAAGGVAKDFQITDYFCQKQALKLYEKSLSWWRHKS